MVTSTSLACRGELAGGLGARRWAPGQRRGSCLQGIYQPRQLL